MEKFAQCLSPVHIGTGVKLEPFDYIVDGERYIRVDQDAFVRRLTVAQAEELTSWVSERADRMAALDEQYRRARREEKQQLRGQLSELRREFNLLNFADTDQNLDQALKTDKELARYEGVGSPDRNLQVLEQLKDADAGPLIPGSSVKGAIRTALVFLAIREMPEAEREVLARQVEQGVRQAEEERQRNRQGRVPRRLQERIGQEFEKAIFRCGKKKGGGANFDDIHFDLMRVVSVADTCAAQVRLVVPQLFTFVKAKADNRRQDNTGLQTQAPLIAEAHAPGNTFRLRVRIDGQLLQTSYGSHG